MSLAPSLKERHDLPGHHEHLVGGRSAPAGRRRTPPRSAVLTFQLRHRQQSSGRFWLSDRLPVTAGESKSRSARWPQGRQKPAVTTCPVVAAVGSRASGSRPTPRPTGMSTHRRGYSPAHLFQPARCRYARVSVQKLCNKRAGIISSRHRRRRYSVV